jgi:hypothetical protein
MLADPSLHQHWFEVNISQTFSVTMSLQSNTVFSQPTALTTRKPYDEAALSALPPNQINSN